MATLELDGWGNGYTPEEEETFETEEQDPIDEVMVQIERLSYILESTQQTFYKSELESIKEKLITIFQI